MEDSNPSNVISEFPCITLTLCSVARSTPLLSPEDSLLLHPQSFMLSFLEGYTSYLLPSRGDFKQSSKYLVILSRNWHGWGWTDHKMWHLCPSSWIQVSCLGRVLMSSRLVHTPSLHIHTPKSCSVLKEYLVSGVFLPLSFQVSFSHVEARWKNKAPSILGNWWSLHILHLFGSLWCASVEFAWVVCMVQLHFNTLSHWRSSLRRTVLSSFSPTSRTSPQPPSGGAAPC